MTSLPGLTRQSIALLALATCLSVAASAQSSVSPAPAAPPALSRSATHGTVFVDRNANGRRDAGEPGLAGVAVSNQDEVTLTDAQGAYALGATGYGAVFVSLPRGYRSVGAFWHRADGAGAVDFALEPHEEAVPFVFALASDTHISEASVARTRRLRAVVDSAGPDFALITGDLVRDALRVGEAEATGYYRLFGAESDAFRTPVFTVMGNHENFGIERHLSLVPKTHPLYGRGMYRAFRGPDYYSFNAGGIHFVGLNSVDFQDLWYYGHVDSLQVAWLRRDLAVVPAGTPIVTFNHIPFYSISEELSGYTDGGPAPSLITIDGKPQFRHTVSNVAEVLKAIAPRPYPLALAGHVHFRERIALELSGGTMRFHQSAATIAPTSSAFGVQPSGVTFYTVRDGVVDDGRFVPLDPARPDR